MGIRWHRPEPRAGFDPDLMIVRKRPPEVHWSSLRLWDKEHEAPWLAVEVVSPSHPYKDYVDTPDRSLAAGIDELWVYDPLLVGPKHTGEPFA